MYFCPADGLLPQRLWGTSEGSETYALLPWSQFR